MFLREAGIQCAPFRLVHSRGELQSGLAEIGYPAILKTSEQGYDGKGQVRIDKPEDAIGAWNDLGPDEAILEGFVDFFHELSILAVRGVDGSITTYGPIANEHTNHILDVAVMPHAAVQSVGAEAADIARTIVDQLEVVGMICVEFFLTTAGRLLVNEIAPRPHNSGHLTIDACVTSQFEQQVRAICGLPLGSNEQLRPAAMANLLGDLWNGGEPDFVQLLANPSVKLHLYGKAEPRPGRKMGHLTALASTGEQAEQVVRAARAALTTNPKS
jgi:5-(carboxyamino)imidazole ribonucleotide synthase